MKMDFTGQEADLVQGGIVKKAPPLTPVNESVNPIEHPWHEGKQHCDITYNYDIIRSEFRL